METNLCTSRKILVVTSSYFPYICGPSVASHERVKYLLEHGHQVTFSAPFIPNEHQSELFTNQTFFEDEEVYEKFVHDRFDNNENLKVIAYPSTKMIHSTFIPACELDELLNFELYDWVIIEEIEHCLFNQSILMTKSRIENLTGIIHTNYSKIVKDHAGPAFQFLYDRYSSWIYSKPKSLFAVSPSLQFNEDIDYASVIGVRESFYGIEPDVELLDGFYFVGQIVDIHKNISDILKFFTKSGKHKIDLYGKGPDTNTLKTKATSLGRPELFDFKGSVSEPWRALQKYKTYVSCSENEGFCTATAEALVMNKFVIIPLTKCNDPFMHFPNVLYYKTEQDFQRQLEFAASNVPMKIDSGIKKMLSWKSVNDRFYSISCPWDN
jgi:hypothetical protein